MWILTAYLLKGDYKMKKLATLTLTIILALTMVFILTACSENETAPVVTPVPTPETSPESTPNPTPEPNPGPEPIPAPEANPGEELLGYWDHGDGDNLFIFEGSEWLLFTIAENGEGRFLDFYSQWGGWAVENHDTLAIEVNDYDWPIDFTFIITDDTLTISYGDDKRTFQRAAVPLITRTKPVHGVVDGSTYTSEYLGLRIDFPGGWEEDLIRKEQQLERLGFDSFDVFPDLFWYTTNSFQELRFVTSGNNSLTINFLQLVYDEVAFNEVDYINRIISGDSPIDGLSFDFDPNQTPIEIGNSLWYELRQVIRGDLGINRYGIYYYSIVDGFARYIFLSGNRAFIDQTDISLLLSTYP